VGGDAVVEVRNLTKAFGEVNAVTDLSFRVDPGEVCGLLGPNGAGKTTTLRMLVGLIRPSEGECRLFGTRVEPGCRELLRVGAMVEQAAFVPHLSGMTNLRLWWEAGGGHLRDSNLEEALAIAGLGAAVNRKVQTYSQGMKQRLGFARLLLSKPELLILDEPTNGLDPGEIREIRLLVRRLADAGSSVLLSSHHLTEVEQTCSRVVVMNRGRLVTEGSVDAIISTRSSVHLEVDDIAKARGVLDTLAGVVDVRQEGAALRLQLANGRRSDVVAALVAAGVRVETIMASENLEEAFLALVDGSSIDAKTVEVPA
jgi:ABC-2 type transport system ATP-binding protein